MFKMAVDFVRRGEPGEARRLLRVVLEQNRDDETAWIWLAMTYPSDAERLRILQYYLDRHPQSDPVGRAVVALRDRVGRQAARAREASAEAPRAESRTETAHLDALQSMQTPAQMQPIMPLVVEVHAEAGVTETAATALAETPADPGGWAAQPEQAREGISETTLILISVAVIMITIMIALVWTQMS
jgi:hypothetical protein